MCGWSLSRDLFEVKIHAPKIYRKIVLITRGGGGACICFWLEGSTVTTSETD